MDHDNTHFLVTLENAISDYAHACFRDGVVGRVGRSEHTKNMKKKLDEHIKTLPFMPDDYDCSGLVYSAKEGKLVPVGNGKPWPTSSKEMV